MSNTKRISASSPSPRLYGSLDSSVDSQWKCEAISIRHSWIIADAMNILQNGGLCEFGRPDRRTNAQRWYASIAKWLNIADFGAFSVDLP